MDDNDGVDGDNDNDDDNKNHNDNYAADVLLHCSPTVAYATDATVPAHGAA